MWRGLVCQAKESGCHPAGDERLLKSRGNIKK